MKFIKVMKLIRKVDCDDTVKCGGGVFEEEVELEL